MNNVSTEVKVLMIDVMLACLNEADATISIGELAQLYAKKVEEL